MTAVYVTHDQTEALTLGDRLAVLKDGLLQQTGTRDEGYRHPANRFVAEHLLLFDKTGGRTLSL